MADEARRTRGLTRVVEVEMGCDHPPRYGGWCEACDAERTVLCAELGLDPDNAHVDPDGFARIVALLDDPNDDPNPALVAVLKAALQRTEHEH